MITANPYGTHHVTRPGYGEPERLKPAHTCDSQENIDRCLDCTVPFALCRGTCDEYRHKPREKEVKPENFYLRGTTIWSVMEGDWEDLTIAQIAEVLDTTYGCIESLLNQIRRDTGYYVPHANMRVPRRKPERAQSTGIGKSPSQKNFL